jgi:hypothetical protein
MYELPNSLYDRYTREVLLPILNTLAETGRLRLVYESEEDMVQVYRILNGQ